MVVTWKRKYVYCEGHHGQNPDQRMYNWRKSSPGNDPGCRTGEQANGLLCPSLDVSKGTLCDCDQNFEELVMEREGVG